MSGMDMHARLPIIDVDGEAIGLVELWWDPRPPAAFAETTLVTIKLPGGVTARVYKDDLLTTLRALDA